MENRAKTHGEKWPFFDLLASMKNAKSSKKVFSVGRFRSDATLRAVRLTAQFPVGGFSAGFSIIDLIHQLCSNIQVDSYQLEGTRRQLQHYNKAPEWRYASAELKATFYQLAMLQEAKQSDHQLTPFTADLTPEFANKALQNKKGFIDYTKRKLDKAMQSELGRIPQYWFVVEFVDAHIGNVAAVNGEKRNLTTRGRKRPHLHGGILLAPSEIESERKQKTPISKAFHKAIGKCHPDFSERLLNLGNHKTYAENKGITEIEASINWAGYCFKLNTIARLFLNSKSNLTADNATKKQAEALYSRLTPKKAKLSPEDEKALKAFMSWN
ncbi:MAG TPA: hypothetical protein VIE65_20515 [Methylobacter sp.]|jgi:hypothetical protein